MTVEILYSNSKLIIKYYLFILYYIYYYKYLLLNKCIPKGNVMSLYFPQFSVHEAAVHIQDKMKIGAIKMKMVMIR